MHRELLEVARIRRTEYLTYRQLGELIGVSDGCVRHFLKDPDPVIHEITLHKIRDYLERREREMRMPPPRRRRHTASDQQVAE